MQQRRLAGNRRDESNAAANIVVGRVRMKGGRGGKKIANFRLGLPHCAGSIRVCLERVFECIFFPRFFLVSCEPMTRLIRPLAATIVALSTPIT